MDTGIFCCKILTLPEVISFVRQEGAFRVVTVRKRFLTSLTKNLQFWWLRHMVFCVDLELQVIGIYFLIASVSPASQLLVMLFVFIHLGPDSDLWLPTLFS